MPHVIVKLYSGRSEQQKATLAEELSKAVVKTLNCGEEAVSVAVEDVKQRLLSKQLAEAIGGRRHRDDHESLDEGQGIAIRHQGENLKQQKRRARAC